jgi:integration host factor subunit beta
MLLFRFWGFRICERKSRIGRNPKSGELVEVPAKKVTFFKAGKELRERVDGHGSNLSYIYDL